MGDTTRPDLGPALPDWTPRPLPVMAPMAGRWCRLEPFDAARHADGLFAAIGTTPALWTWLPFAPPADAAALGALLAAANAPPTPRYLSFVIIDRSTDTIVGTASYMRIDPEHGSIEVGFVVYGPALQRQPGATEAQFLLASHVLDTLGYRRYEWKCNALNAASRRAAARLGFRFEGVFRNAQVIKGHSRDTAWFAMTDADWRAVRPVLAAWLAPDNIAEGGRQRQSLTAMMATCHQGT